MPPTMEVKPRVTLRLLGSFGAEMDGGRELHIGWRRGQALLAYLAMQTNHQRSREGLADLLWGNRLDRQARHSLRQCLVYVRRALQPVGAEVLTSDTKSLGLDPRLVAVDALKLVSLAESTDPADLARAADLYRGEFLTGLNLNLETFDQWVRTERSRFTGIMSRVFAELAEHWDASGDAGRAVATAERLVALDSLREDSQRLLLWLYARHRGREAALTYAKTVTALLHEELDAQPDPQTAALIAAIRRGEIAPASSIKVLPEQPATNETKPASQAASRDVTRDRRHDRISSRLAAGRAVRKTWKIASVAALFMIVAGAVWLFPSLHLQLAQLGLIATVDAPTQSQSWRSPSIHPEIAAHPDVLAAKGLFAVVVLPFTTDTAAGSTEQRLADRITVDLINDLSRAPGIRVIAHQTSRLYRGRPIDVATIGAELGVRFAVEGSLRMQESSVRINVALIDVATRLQVWAERFERDQTERFAVQDEIARGLARRLQVNVFVGEASRRPLQDAGDPAVEGLIAKGWGTMMRAYKTGSAHGADGFFEQVLRRDRNNVSALIGLAAFDLFNVAYLVVPEREPHMTRAEELIERAIEKNADVSSAHFFLGLLRRMRGQRQLALDGFNRALDLNPSYAPAYAHRGVVLSNLGQPGEAKENIRYAIRLSPQDPAIGHWNVLNGLVEFEQGSDEAAIDWMKRGLALNPRNVLAHAALAAAYALRDDAAAAARHAAELRRLAPAFSNEAILHHYGGTDGISGHGERFLRGLRRALGPAI